MASVSRVGKVPVKFDKSKVQCTLDGSCIHVKAGSKQMSVSFRPEVEVVLNEDHVLVNPRQGHSNAVAFQGLYRTLIANAVTGVVEGFQKTLILNGVGYRANVSGKTLNLSLGYSHPIELEIPEGLEVKVEKQTKVSVSGIDKALVGQFSANVRSWRPVEPYLGKGIRYEDEQVRRKAGKAGGK